MIDVERCKGCGLCVSVCPKRVIELSNEHLNTKGYPPSRVIRPEECIGCTMCATICPDLVIEIEECLLEDEKTDRIEQDCSPNKA